MVPFALPGLDPKTFQYYARTSTVPENSRLMSTYREIIVHAGFSKTGTTSIQDNCERFSAFLRERGIVYPQFHFNNQPFITHSIPVTVAITGHPGKYGLRLPKRFPGEVDAVIHSCKAQMDQLLREPAGDTLLLSTELIEGFDAQDMATLRTCLAPHAQRLRMLVYVRSPQSGLESLLQERIKVGGLPDPHRLVGRVRQKVENVQRGCGDILEVRNFHQAIRHDGGLVGAFFEQLGVAVTDMASLEFSSSNERLCTEAFKLMWAINERFPPRDQAIHHVPRQPYDLQVLSQLPGAPFQLDDFISSGLHQRCLEEAAWLESRLGFEFPHEQRKSPQPLWQDATLAQLEQTVRALVDPQMIRFVGDFLLQQAQSIAPEHEATSRQLAEIAQRLQMATAV